jgi:hypothetical protein
MTLAHAGEIFAVVNFTVVGLSHLAQPRAWAEFFFHLRSLGSTGVFVNAMLSLLVGSIIVSLHNDWSGAGAVVTFLGWAQVIKGAISLTIPSVGMRGLMRVSMDRAWEFQAAGVIFLGISAFIAWNWRTP